MMVRAQSPCERSTTAVISNRSIDPTAANVIIASDKVLQFERGQIPLPEVVELWLANFCNFACPHCRCVQSHGGREQFLELDTLDSLLVELSAKGVKTLELGGGGEPLQHPQIDKVLRRFATTGFRIGLITNGYSFVENPSLIDLVLECSDWVRFSLDAISDDVFKTVHGRPDVNYRALR
jgi:MoaA/NifB/PqqE/SkfB family radical SAM enzyme